MKPGEFRFESICFDCPVVGGRIMDVFMPEEASREISLFFVHGGGWSAGSRIVFHEIMRAFNDRGFICASSDYRPAGGGATFKDQLTDLRHAYDIFSTELQKQNRPARIASLGSSAGAHLALLLSLAPPGGCGERTEFNGRNLQNEWTPPEAAILQAAPARFEPWEDIFPPAWKAMERAVGVPYAAGRENYRSASPLEYAGKDSCPLFFMHAGNEHMFPLRHIEEFRKKMRAAESRCELKIYANAEHGFFYDITRRVQKEAFGDILAFLESLG